MIPTPDDIKANEQAAEELLQSATPGSEIGSETGGEPDAETPEHGHQVRLHPPVETPDPTSPGSISPEPPLSYGAARRAARQQHRDANKAAREQRNARKRTARDAKTAKKPTGHKVKLHPVQTPAAAAKTVLSLTEIRQAGKDKLARQRQQGRAKLDPPEATTPEVAPESAPEAPAAEAAETAEGPALETLPTETPSPADGVSGLEQRLHEALTRIERLEMELADRPTTEAMLRAMRENIIVEGDRDLIHVDQNPHESGNLFVVRGIRVHENEPPASGMGAVVKITAVEAGGGKYTGKIVSGTSTAVATGDLAMPEGLTVPDDANALVLNLTEDGLNSHTLKIDQYLVGRLIGTTEEDPPRSIVVAGGSEMGVFPVKVQNDGGADGDDDDPATYTYTVRTIQWNGTSGGAVLGTAVALGRPRPAGKVIVQAGSQGYGMAFYDEDGALVLWDAGEIENTRDCTE